MSGSIPIKFFGLFRTGFILFNTIITGYKVSNEVFDFSKTGFNPFSNIWTGLKALFKPVQFKMELLCVL